MDNLTTALAALANLLPRSVSDQAAKMFVKRLLKALFDRLEAAAINLSYLVLTSLLQALWLSVFQHLAQRAASASTTPTASSAATASTSTQSLAGSSQSLSSLDACFALPTRSPDASPVLSVASTPGPALPRAVTPTDPRAFVDGGRDSSPDSDAGIRNNAVAYAERLRRGSEVARPRFAQLRAWAERRQRVWAREEQK